MANASAAVGDHDVVLEERGIEIALECLTGSDGVAVQRLSGAHENRCSAGEHDAARLTVDTRALADVGRGSGIGRRRGRGRYWGG